MCPTAENIFVCHCFPFGPSVICTPDLGSIFSTHRMTILVTECLAASSHSRRKACSPLPIPRPSRAVSPLSLLSDIDHSLLLSLPLCLQRRAFGYLRDGLRKGTSFYPHTTLTQTPIHLQSFISPHSPSTYSSHRTLPEPTVTIILTQPCEVFHTQHPPTMAKLDYFTF